MVQGRPQPPSWEDLVSWRRPSSGVSVRMAAVAQDAAWPVPLGGQGCEPCAPTAPPGYQSRATMQSSGPGKLRPGLAGERADSGACIPPEVTEQSILALYSMRQRLPRRGVTAAYRIEQCLAACSRVAGQESVQLAGWEGGGRRPRLHSTGQADLILANSTN